MVKSLVQKMKAGDFYTGVLYGMVNGVMLIPIAVSFCSIIFRHTAYQHHIQYLVRLVLFSSLVHQLAFSKFSSLPFAIGQVQDAGLIFLSAMAASIANNLVNSPDQIVPTALFTLAICTFLLGGALIVVSKLKLASVIQYLPMPVIGGYLAFIGFFCGEAGLSMMANVQVSSIKDFHLFLEWNAIVSLTPGLIGGIAIYLIIRSIKSPYVLPCCMLGILAIFYIVLVCCGMSLADARDAGWIAPLAEPTPFYEAWLLYDVTLVDWSQLPQQCFRWFGMFLVVAFSSSLDVAAIEMELGLPLDYNRELQTVGIANLSSGLLGGYTGSYIFSQTIFTMRRGVQSRLCGYTVAILELIVIMLPVSITSYVPKLFFGSLLVFIAVDLMYEWLIAAKEKMMNLEYYVCVLTFFAIQVTGIEAGMMIGVILSMITFIITYAQLQRVSAATLRTSTVVRTFDESNILFANRGKVVTISLQGYIFFGSAVQILEDVKSNVMMTKSPSEDASINEDVDESQEEEANFQTNRSSIDVTPGSPKTQNGTLGSILEWMSYYGRDRRASSGEYTPLNTFETQNGESKDLLSKKAVFSPKLTMVGALSPIRSRSNTLRQSFDTNQSQASPHDDANLSRNQAEKVRSMSGSPKTLDGFLPYQRSNSLSGNSSSMLLLSDKARSSERNESAELVSLRDKITPTRRSSYGAVEVTMPKDAISVPQPTNKIEIRSSKINGTSPNDQGATLSQSASPKFSIFKSIYDMTDEDISRWTQHKLQLASTAPPATTFVAVRNRSHSKSDIESGIIPGASSKTVIRKEEAPELGRKSGLTRDIDKANRAAGIGSMKTEHGGDADERRRRFDSWTVGEDLDGSLNRSQSGDVEIGNNDSGLMPMLAPPFDDSPRKSGVVPSASSPSLLATVWDIQGQKRKTTNALAASATNLLIRRNSLSKKDLKLISGDSRRPSGNFNDRELLHKEFSFISGFKPPTLAEPSQKNEPDNDDMILTEFLVIDFTQVLGVDATAARTCFLMLVQLMKSADVTVVFANMSPAVESLFQCHSVLQNGDVVVIPHLDDALEWCEEQVLYRVTKGSSIKAAMTRMNSITGGCAKEEGSKGMQRDPGYYSRAWRQRQELGRAQLFKGETPIANNDVSDDSLVEEKTRTKTPVRALRRILEDYLEIDSHSHEVLRELLSSEMLIRYFKRRRYKANAMIFDIGDEADKIYFIEKGVVEIVTMSQDVLSQLTDSYGVNQESPSNEALVRHVADTPRNRTPSVSVVNRKADHNNNSDVQRVNKVSSGGCFGEADFFLSRAHSVRVYTLSDCVIWTLDRQSFSEMEVTHPKLCMLIQHTLLKSLSVTATNAMYAMHPTTAYSSNNQ